MQQTEERLFSGFNIYQTYSKSIIYLRKSK